MDIINPLPPAIVTAVTGQPLRVIIVPIGTWNMDIQQNRSVNVAIPFGRIHSVQTFIYQDVAANIYPIDHSVPGGNPAGAWYVVGDQINLTRHIGEFFDSVDFNDAVMNRGYLVLWYEM